AILRRDPGTPSPGARARHAGAAERRARPAIRPPRRTQPPFDEEDATERATRPAARGRAARGESAWRAERYPPAATLPVESFASVLPWRLLLGRPAHRRVEEHLAQLPHRAAPRSPARHPPDFTQDLRRGIRGCAGERREAQCGEIVHVVADECGGR